ncbi:MAG: iron-containing alcohol dehydrogenase [Oscillospiraceae bacterium]|nr:iron-containing alcohol dehydrogenase [Oscillospiraceae bacterium]MCL2278626.1 iron-containing alcohol dehydrogenase [Oscillospiraceae bacterium]
MNNFQFSQPTVCIFGREPESAFKEQLRKRNVKKVLFHYGGGSIKKNGVYDMVSAVLKELNIETIELSGVQPNPRVTLVREGIDICRKNGIDLILAVGGGSVIDSAKGIAVGAAYDGDVWDLYIDKAGESDLKKPLIPVGVVLTIPAAGSESSPGSVLSNDEGLMKRPLNSELIIPVFAVLNPEYTFTLPVYQVACGCSDIMAHMFERYFTRQKNVDVTDRQLEANMRSMLHYSKLAQDFSDDYDIKAEVMWAGTIAHNDMLSCGRSGDWASHNIEHELSAIYDIYHGEGLSIVFPAWIRYCWKDDPERFLQFFKRVFDVDYAFSHAERAINEGIARLENYYTSLGLPIRLSQVEIGEDRLREMADKCVMHRGDSIGNFKKLTADDIYNIYRLAL